MRLSCRNILFFFLTCSCLTLITSCAQTPPYEEDINIIISPHKLSVHSGSEDKIFITLLDKQGGPLFGMKVNAISTSKTTATITPENAITDAAGKALFFVHGISPGSANIVFSVAGQKASAEVIFIEH